MAEQFVHLHLHTQYSFLDGAIKVSELIPRVKELGMDAVAITDHGVMYGMVELYKTARKHEIKPILGCETYVTAGDHRDRTTRDNYHLTLLAESNEGYYNLVRLVSTAHMQGFYYNPRIDKALLAAHHQGIIALSGCLGGEVSQAFLTKGYDAAKAKAAEYKEIMGPGCYYLELMHNGLEEQQRFNEAAVRIGEELGIPLVATNDCHYMRQEDAFAQEVLMCISTGKTLDDESRIKHEGSEYYLKDPATMRQQFAHLPQALAATREIADRCNVTLELGKTYLPRFPVPEGHDLKSYLCEQARAGLERRFAEMRARGQRFDEATYRARLEQELGIIIKMDFPGYFLVVWDFIRYAKEHGIPVGPGRGSGAGSLVAYALRITNIDPLPYDLLFERFLNPERVSLPDFDIDFCMNRREEVIQYVAEKYGRENVAQIATFGVLKAKSCIRDVGRVMGLPYGEVDKIAKLVPEELNITLDTALEKEPRLRELVESNEVYRRLYATAKSLEGLNRQAGMHAAGVVIGNKPICEYVPIKQGPNGEMVTQFAKDEVEQAGLVKFDFLGLKTLTLIDDAVKLINRRRAAAGQPPLDIDALPLDDPETYRLLSRADTAGVFQLESSGFQEVIRRLKPDRFEDIIALGAIYRPGPLKAGAVDNWIDRKQGRKPITYPHPATAKVLEPTYGVIVYQEQVMRIAVELCGFTMGQADTLRKAMGKKNPQVMAQQREAFVSGAVAHSGMNEAKAAELFDQIEVFAGYAFNKSHSAAYGLVTYQTAYLKAHYPVEFMTALLTSEKDNTDKLVQYIGEAKAMGIPVLGPDINESETDFSVSGNKIRFGLGAVKGVGEAAVAAMLEARQGDGSGPFASFYDFIERVDSKRVNKKVIEALVKCGAFDSFCRPRAQLLETIERACDRAAARQREAASGQSSLFGLFADLAPPTSAAGQRQQAALDEEIYPEVEEFPEKLRLKLEKETLGFYISGHPLERYADEVRRLGVAACARLTDKEDRAPVTLAGVVSALRERPAKSGNGRNAFVQLEDMSGSVEVLVFWSVYEGAEDVLKGEEPVLVRGTVTIEGEGESRTAKVKADEVLSLVKVREEQTRAIALYLDASRHGPEVLSPLRRLLQDHPGHCNTYIIVDDPLAEMETVIKLGEGLCCTPTDDLLAGVERLLLGPNCYGARAGAGTGNGTGNGNGNGRGAGGPGGKGNGTTGVSGKVAAGGRTRSRCWELR